MRRCLQLIFAIVAICVFPMTGAVAGSSDATPSFDCAKASLPDEKAICADPELAAIDVLIADAFKGFDPAYGGDKKEIARALAADRKQCGVERACIASAEANTLGTYGSAPAWVQSYVEGLIGHKALMVAAKLGTDADQPMPTAIGQCAVTHIAELTTRFGEGALAQADDNAGSLVTFRNGGVQVSYEHDYGLANSQVGDAAVVCLINIPRDCPEGDDRGRVYYGVDLVIGGNWALPDSQHMCGGA
jgi:uncharacterized protein